MSRDISPAVAVAIAAATVCAVFVHPAAATAQVTFTSTTTINGNIRIYGRDILPMKPEFVPLRRVKVSLYLYETCFEFEACRDSVHAIGWIADANGDRLHDYTDDEGNFTISWQAEQQAAVEPLDLALEITLEHEEGLVRSRDMQRSHLDTACMITAGFRVNRGDTVDANVQMSIGTSNNTDYHARSIGFSPSSVEGSCFENAVLTEDGPEISWVPMVGISNVGGDRFAHHAVLYERTLDAALFARDVLGETGLPLATVQGWDTGTGAIPKTTGKSFGPCPTPFIHVTPAESPLANSVSAGANIFDMRHEYGHFVHCASPISGAGSIGSAASVANHANLQNDDSGDSWSEGFATYFAAALAESLGEPNPELQETQAGVADLWDGGARIDQPTVAGWATSAGAQITNGALAEEIMIASLLWEVHVNIGRDVLWNILRANDPDLQTLLEVHDILANDVISATRFATRTCNIPASGGGGAGLDCLFINRGVYHDEDGDGLFDTGELAGVTRWPPEFRDASVARRNVPVIPGSEMLLTVVDASGVALADAALEISIEYDPPLQSSSFQYVRQLTGPQPYRIPILVPGNPSRATVRAIKAGYQTVAGPVIDWEVFHDLINPFRPGGLADSLLSHAFVLPSTAAANRAPVALNDSYSVWTGAVLTIAGPGVLANDDDPDADALSATLVTPPASGSLAMAPDGSFTYTPPPGFTGEVTFTYGAGDGHSHLVSTEVHIRVDPRPQLDYMFGDGRSDAAARDTWRLELRCDGVPGFFEFVNGTNGDKFRLLAMTSLSCVDDPAIPNLPGMMFDTLTLAGVGKWNGRSDVAIRATISDSSRNAGADILTIAITRGGETLAARTLTGGTHTARSKPRR